MNKLPTVIAKYMANGNEPKPTKPGDYQFPVIELSDKSRCVGRTGQSYDELINDCMRRGTIASPSPEGKPKVTSK